VNNKEDSDKKSPLTLRQRFRLQFDKYWKYTRKWFPFAILVGVISGIIMSLFTALVVNLQIWLDFIPVYIKYPLVGRLTSLFLYIGIKEVRGAGMSHVLAHKNTTTPLHPRVLLTKFFTSVLTLGVNAPAGREGPAVTLGSTASSVLGEKLGMTQEDETHAITIGAAACTAAVFRAPLGGTVFAAEVPYKRDLDETVFLPALVASAIALLVSDAILRLLQSTPEYLQINASNLDLKSTFFMHCILFGIIAGFIGIGFSLLFKTLAKWLENYLKAFLLPIIGMILTVLIVFFIDQFYFADQSLTGDVTLAGTGFSSINTLLNNYGSTTVQILFVLLIGKIIATSACIGFGNSAGIMGPTLVTGAALGCLYSNAFSFSQDYAVAMMIIGMSAMHTSTTKTPIASMILVLEMVGFPNLVIPIILSNAMAFMISMDFSLYSGQIQSKEVILRRRIQYTDLLETLSVKEAMEETFPIVKETDLLSESISHLYLHKTSALIVVNDKNELVGVISAIDFQTGFARGKEHVSDVMTRDVITAYPDESLVIAFDRLTTYRIEIMPVVERKKPKRVIGTVSYRDIENRYETALTKLQSQKELTIEEIEDDI
jgi:CIC family chloride channel protein